MYLHTYVPARMVIKENMQYALKIQNIQNMQKYTICSKSKTKKYEIQNSISGVLTT